MDLRHLIDAIVQRTMVLIAQLATADGVRTPLSSVADQVFMDLIGELESQGVRRKVVADMFGLALRSYQKRVQRLAEGGTERGSSLWSAVLGYLQKGQAVTRGQVMERFKRDDEAMVKAVLADLVDHGLVFKAGSADATVYRAAGDSELDLQEAAFGPALAPLVWLTLYRHGPLDRAELGERHRRLAPERLDHIVARLVGDGLAAAQPDGRYHARHFLPAQADLPWAVAVSDHFEALITTLCRSLAKDPADPWARSIGGSTYTFDLWPGHPHADEVLALLAKVRADTSRLRALVTTHNDAHPERSGDAFRATFYVGGHVTPQAIPDDFPAPRRTTEDTSDED